MCMYVCTKFLYRRGSWSFIQRGFVEPKGAFWNSPYRRGFGQLLYQWEGASYTHTCTHIHISVFCYRYSGLLHKAPRVFMKPLHRGAWDFVCLCMYTYPHFSLFSYRYFGCFIKSSIQRGFEHTYIPIFQSFYTSMGCFIKPSSSGAL